MPRGAFELAGQTHPVVTSRGDRIGRIIPGHGIALDSDLKTLGITKSIPGVIGRSAFMQVVDALVGEAGAITSMASLVATTKRMTYVKQDTFTPNGASDFQAYFNFAPVGGAHDFGTVGTIAPTRTSFTDAYNSQLHDPPAGKTKYLIGMSAIGTGTAAFGMGIYVDMLSMFGAVPLDSTGAQTINSAALTRYTTGAGVYLFFAPDAVAPGTASYATTPTFTVTYTNQAGTGSQTTTFQACSSAFTNILTAVSLVVDQLEMTGSVLVTQPFVPLASGDYGMRSVQTIQSSVASSGAGAAMKGGGALMKPLLFLHAISEVGVLTEREARSEPEIMVPFAVDGSNVLGCHQMIWLSRGAGSATTGIFMFDTCEA